VVLATPVGDVPNRLDPGCAFITSGVDGETVVQQMADAAIALDADRDRMARMKAAALEKARQEFGMERFQARYRALLLSPSA
jgi:glycosyltransferase involved in cell wall biosynthesis